MFFRSLDLVMTTWTAKLSSVAALLVFTGSFFPVTAQTATGEDSLITIESDTQSADNITGVVTAVGSLTPTPMPPVPPVSIPTPLCARRS